MTADLLRSQWGNMLVLAATFKDPILHTMVDESLLRALFARTIRFLRQSATATSSLRIDMHILEGLQHDLFPQDLSKTNSSFSSSAGMNTPKILMAAPPLLPQPPGELSYLSTMPSHAQINMAQGR